MFSVDKSSGVVGAVVVLALLSAPVVAEERTDVAQQPPQSARVKAFEVAAGRYSFAPDTIEVVVGDVVRLTLRSLDVDHGIAIDAFDVDSRIPEGGDPGVVEFLADRVGEFLMQCPVFCGMGHERMSGTVIVRRSESELTNAAGGPPRVPQATGISRWSLFPPRTSFLDSRARSASRIVSAGRSDKATSGRWSRTSSGSIRAR